MTPELAEKIIREALEQDEDYTFEDVLAAVSEGTAVVFYGLDALEIVQIRQDVSGELELYAWLGGGNFRTLRDDIRPRVEKFARLNGCAYIEMRTRPVAATILAPWGYAITGKVDDQTVIIRKVL